MNSQKKKKERGQCQAILTQQAWPIKNLLYGFRRNVSCGTRRVVLSGQDSSTFARSGNQSQRSINAAFDSSCPLTKLARHIITSY